VLDDYRLKPVILATWESAIGRKREDCDLRPAQANSSPKSAGGLAQVVGCLLGKHEALIKPHSYQKIPKLKYMFTFRGNS
jgi:hypothetical protein